jgi:cation transport ATPase
MDYIEFRKQYEEQHPASVPVEEIYIGEYPAWVTWAVGAMFVAAAFFSGIHTVPVAYRMIERFGVAEWLRQAGGISAFLFIELAVLVSAYMLVKRRSVVMLIILLIAICVAMGANLYSVSEAFLPEQFDSFARMIAVMFGVVAPLMAALAGGVFVWLHHAERVAEARAKTAFKELKIAWDKEIERAHKRAYPAASRPVQSVSIGQSAVSSIGHKKVVDATVRAQQYLDAHPEDLNLSPRELARKIGVGKSTANNVQRWLREQKGYVNGHGDEVQ